MNTLKRITFLLITLALLCSNIPMAQAQDEPSTDKKVFLPLVTTEISGGQDAVEPAATKIFSPAEQKAALTFWTRETIAAAQPMELQAQLGTDVDTALLPGAEVSGPPLSVAPTAAAPGADKAAKAAYPLDWAELEEELDETAEAAALLAPAGTSQIYSSYVVNQLSAVQKIYPHQWVGRLSATVPFLGTSYCSGTSIRGNVMVTAAHCLFDTTTNIWYSNVVFTPAYRSGNTPYGTFAATQCWVLPAWINLTGLPNLTWAPHDVAVCKMGVNSAGTTLNNAVGAMGYLVNQPYIRHFHNLGYAWQDYNNLPITNAGLFLRTCVGESFQQTTEVRGMGCNLGKGMSGGPWMVGYAPGVLFGWVDGVNSSGILGTQNIYSGRFNSNNIVPLCTLAGCS